MRPRAAVYHAAMATSKLNARMLVGAAILFVLLGGVAAALWLVPRMPLDGPREHDFGEVEIRGIASNLAASLTFANDSSETVRIGPVKPTCSCVNARVDRNEVEPGGVLTLHLGMKLVDSARKDVTVNMLVEGHGVLSVALTARGRKTQGLSAGQTEIRVARGQSFTTTIHGEVWPGETTDAPDVQAPAGVHVEVLNWRLAKEASTAEARPAMYAGELNVTADEGAELGDRPATLRLGAGPELSLPIRVVE
jgi:hypothetical protein